MVRPIRDDQLIHGEGVYEPPEHAAVRGRHQTRRPLLRTCQ